MIKILAGAAASDEGTPTERLQAPMPVSEAAAAIAEPTEQVQTPTAEELSLTDKDLLDIIYNTERGAEDIASSVDRPRTLVEQKEDAYLASPEGQDAVSREGIDNIRKRLKDARSGERTNIYHAENQAKERAKASVSSEFGPDGGIFSRANNLPNLINNPDNPFSPEGGTGIRLNTAIGPAQLAAGTGGAYSQLMQDVGAVTGHGSSNKVKFNPSFLKVSSLVTENYFAGEFDSADRDTNDLGEMSLSEPEELLPKALAKKQAGSARLGKMIFEENQREAAALGTPPAKLDSLTNEQATLLGDSFKEIYAAANPDMMVKKMSGKQSVFELTNVGAAKLGKSENARRQMFPKEHVLPKKAPALKGKQMAEGKGITKEVTGEHGKKSVGKHKRTAEAVENLGSIPNVVDKQREKILYVTILPVLQGRGNETALEVMADMNNIGHRARNKALAAEKAAKAVNEPYSALDTMRGLMHKAAQEVFSIATERNGANFLTYTIQAFAGRLTPNQTGFNPTTSKLVRFVTRNATPVTVHKGSRTDRNLRQMYAMMLVKGADVKLPATRDKMLTGNTDKLVKWGRRLRASLDNAMLDSELEAVASAIQNGMALDDPNFPQTRGLDLDPNNESDAELIRAISSKGEDGQHFIDGLIDFSKYHHALKNGKAYKSYFNAYIDGKTNGLAAMGIQMGSRQLALSTGVLRNQDFDLLDDGDIRDQLQASLEARIKDRNNGLDLPDTGLSDVEVELYDVALGLFKHRAFNKKTTMVFGYGMDISGFVPMMSEFAGELAAIADSMTIADREAAGLTTFSASLDIVNQQLASNIKSDPDALRSLGKYLLPTYESSLSDVLDADALYARSLMKGAAYMSAFAGELFEIEGPGGFPLKFGGIDEDSFGIEESRQSYTLNGKPQTSIVYEKPTESARATKDVEVAGSVRKKNRAAGASVPGPIHATDAYTITYTLSGNSWKKIKAASNGNPYIHTIYDAVKMDANGYDVVLEEVNNNWMKANTEWSFLDAMVVSVDRSRGKMKKTYNAIPDNTVFKLESIDPVISGLLKMSETEQFVRYPGAVIEMFNTLFPSNKSDKARDIAKAFVGTMRSAGYDMYKPSGDITGAQVKEVYKFIISNYNVDSQLRDLSSKVKVKQKKLLAEIKGSGNAVLQYYAH